MEARTPADDDKTISRPRRKPMAYFIVAAPNTTPTVIDLRSCGRPAPNKTPTARSSSVRSARPFSKIPPLPSRGADTREKLAKHRTVVQGDEQNLGPEVERHNASVLPEPRPPRAGTRTLFQKRSKAAWSNSRGKSPTTTFVASAARVESPAPPSGAARGIGACGDGNIRLAFSPPVPPATLWMSPLVLQSLMTRTICPTTSPNKHTLIQTPPRDGVVQRCKRHIGARVAFVDRLDLCGDAAHLLFHRARLVAMLHAQGNHPVDLLVGAQRHWRHRRLHRCLHSATIDVHCGNCAHAHVHRTRAAHALNLYAPGAKAGALFQPSTEGTRKGGCDRCR